MNELQTVLKKLKAEKVHDRKCPRHGWKRTKTRDGTPIPASMRWHSFKHGYAPYAPECECAAIQEAVKE